MCTCLLFLERCKKSYSVWLRALMQSDCLDSSSFFERYSRILLCGWLLGCYSVTGRVQVTMLVLHLALARVGLQFLTWDFHVLLILWM